MLNQIGIEADADRYLWPGHNCFRLFMPIIWNAIPIGIAGNCALYIFVGHGLDASGIGAAFTMFGQLAKLIYCEALDAVFVHLFLPSGAR